MGVCQCGHTGDAPRVHHGTQRWCSCHTAQAGQQAWEPAGPSGFPPEEVTLGQPRSQGYLNESVALTVKDARSRRVKCCLGSCCFLPVSVGVDTFSLSSDLSVLKVGYAVECHCSVLVIWFRGCLQSTNLFNNSHF